MATLAAAFARYFAQLVAAARIDPRSKIWQAGAAVLAIAVVTTVNVLGTRRGGTLQVVGTVLKVGGVAVLIALPFAARGRHAGELLAGLAERRRRLDLHGHDGRDGQRALGLRRLDQRHAAGRGDPRPRPQRPARLDLGMAVLIAVYLGMTLAYHYVLPMDEVGLGQRRVEALRERRGRRLLRAPAGAAGRRGDLDPGHVLDVHLAQRQRAHRPAGLLRHGARWTVSRPRSAGCTRRFQTPANAILAQGIWAILLTSPARS